MICRVHRTLYPDAADCAHFGDRSATVIWQDGYRVDIDAEGVETFIPLEATDA